MPRPLWSEERGGRKQRGKLCGPQMLFCLNEPDLHSPVQGSGDPLQHRQRMARIVGIFQPTDDRCRRAHKPGQLSLAEPPFRTPRGNLASHVVVGARPFEGSKTVWFSFVIAAM